MPQCGQAGAPLLTRLPHSRQYINAIRMSLLRSGPEAASLLAQLHRSRQYINAIGMILLRSGPAGRRELRRAEISRDGKDRAVCGSVQSDLVAAVAEPTLRILSRD